VVRRWPHEEESVEITIGVRNLPREITLDSAQTSDQVAAEVAAALAGKPALELVDERGRRIIVPTAAIGYVEIGAEARGRVGFNTM
jgi:hypothetical protein